MEVPGETIPEDIRAKAERLVEKSQEECNWIKLHKAFARALLAERLASTERAARVVESLDTAVYSREFIDWLAAAIRSQP